MSSSESYGTGTIDISSHNPSRKATRTIAPTTTSKAHIPNHSVEDIYYLKREKNPEIVKSFTCNT